MFKWQKQNTSSAVVKLPGQFSSNDGFLFYEKDTLLTEIIKMIHLNAAVKQLLSLSKLSKCIYNNIKWYLLQPRLQTLHKPSSLQRNLSNYTEVEKHLDIKVKRKYAIQNERIYLVPNAVCCFPDLQKQVRQHSHLRGSCDSS